MTRSQVWSNAPETESNTNCNRKKLGEVAWCQLPQPIVWSVSCRQLSWTWPLSPAGTWRWRSRLFSGRASGACVWCWIPPSPRQQRSGTTAARPWIHSSPALCENQEQITAINPCFPGPFYTPTRGMCGSPKRSFIFFLASTAIHSFVLRHTVQITKT